MRRAHVLGLAALAVASLTLTGCEKPAPGVSVFNGPQSVRSEALCWAFDSDQLSPGTCAQEILQGQTTTGVATMTAIPGDPVGISVDPDVAEAGWTVRINGQELTSAPLTDTYFRFQLPDLPAPIQQPLLVQVIAGQNTKIRGVWIIALTP